jgi:hypothetical protein
MGIICTPPSVSRPQRFHLVYNETIDCGADTVTVMVWAGPKRHPVVLVQPADGQDIADTDGVATRIFHRFLTKILPLAGSPFVYIQAIPRRRRLEPFIMKFSVVHDHDGQIVLRHGRGRAVSWGDVRDFLGTTLAPTTGHQ